MADMNWAWYIIAWPMLFLLFGAAAAGIYALFQTFFGKD